MRIKDISAENRPRERFISHGPEALSNAELLAIILQKGTREENVIDMSNRLLSKFGIDKLADLSLKEMQEIKGIGPAKAIQLKAITEYSKRIQLKSNAIKSINCAKDVFNYASPKLSRLKQENFMIILLDSKNNIINEQIMFVGTLNALIVHPREIFKFAIKDSANSIVLVHNHPSGDCKPSSKDIKIAEKLEKVGEIIDINVLDNVIIGNNTWWSKNEV
jgi:DNA repair protein RadC